MNKRTLCLYFQVHQPLSLRKYHFFDIGKNRDYYDDFVNRSLIKRLAERCYLPANNMMLELIKKYGKNFKVSFSMSGIVVEQFQQHAPEVIDSFKALAKTGCVEFLAETYSHSLASLADESEFKNQVKRQSDLMKSLFGAKPVTFRNTGLIYSDEIGAMVAKMGYTTMLTEGARHVLGWKSPNFIYTNSINPKLKLLLRNSRLSDDIRLRFSNHSWSEWPLTAERYVGWLNQTSPNEEVINLFMEYETLGEYQSADSGILSFFTHLPEQVFAASDFEFLTPKEVVTKHQPVAPLHVPFPISWEDEERDLTAWLGNELQNEAFEELFQLSDKIKALKNEAISHNFDYLQASNNLYYMCTKLFSDGDTYKHDSPYDTPYEAFINYMNVVSDFAMRVNEESGKGKVHRVKKDTVSAAESCKDVLKD